MKIFLSWSGPRSAAVAAALHTWLRQVLQTAVEPWQSKSDIASGERWATAIGTELEGTRFGIICLTPENIERPWVLFEAGALSKGLKDTFVCPYLLDLEPSNVEPPLGQFQGRRANKEDTWKLLETINSVIDKPLDANTLLETFEMWWPKLKEKLTAIPAPLKQDAPKEERSPSDKLDEMLGILRSMQRERADDAFSDPANYVAWNAAMEQLKGVQESRKERTAREAATALLRGLAEGGRQPFAVGDVVHIVDGPEFGRKGVVVDVTDGLGGIGLTVSIDDGPPLSMSERQVVKLPKAKA